MLFVRIPIDFVWVCTLALYDFFVTVYFVSPASNSSIYVHPSNIWLVEEVMKKGAAAFFLNRGNRASKGKMADV